MTASALLPRGPQHVASRVDPHRAEEVAFTGHGPDEATGFLVASCSCFSSNGQPVPKVRPDQYDHFAASLVLFLFPADPTGADERIMSFPAEEPALADATDLDAKIQSLLDTAAR